MMRHSAWSRRFLVLLGCLCAAMPASARDLPEFADLVEKCGPSVVNVSTTQVVRLTRRGEMDARDPAADLFRRFAPKGTPKEEDTQSLGSGFIISADGYILTNAHVVENADEVTVRVTDKRDFRARIIGADKRSDVALLKIDANNLPKATIGDPGKLRVGDWVMAIGSPFGFDHTVTAGIVSAKGRALPDDNLVPYIQTDVPINPGNSGGPLLNLKCEVVGINAQIYSETGGFMGLSFAIPIDLAMDVHAQLRASGRVTRGRIGVVIQEVTRDVADSFLLKAAQGALVSGVEKNGPADRAGILVGDVILRFDGKQIPNSSDLPRIVGAIRPGNHSTAQVWRRGALRDVAMVVAEYPDDAASGPKAASRKVDALAVSGNRLGLLVSPMTADQKRRAKSDIGVGVKNAVGVAARAQLHAGDVVVSATRAGVPTEFRTVDAFNRFASGIQRGESISLLVRRGDVQSFVSLRVAEQP